MKVFPVIFATGAATALFWQVDAVSPNPDFYKLNDALSGVIFGDNPGPCPSKEQPCEAQIEDMPQWVKDMKVKLLFGLVSFKIGDVVKSGKVRAWNSRFSTLSFDDIQVKKSTITSENGVETMPFTALVDDIRMDAFSHGEFEDLELDVTLFTMKVNGNTDIVMTRSKMSGDGEGITADLKGKFQSPDFLTSPPKTFSFEDGEAGCSVKLGNGIELQNFYIEEVGSLISSGVELLIFTMFKGMIQNIICQVITQLAYLDDGRKGIINQAIEDVNTNLDGYVAEGLTTPKNWEEDENSAYPDKGTKAVKFGSDTNFQDAAALVRNLLSTDSALPRYTGRPAINEVVDVLIGDTTGLVTVDNVKELFMLKEYPKVDFSTVILEGEIIFKGFALGGLNTISKFETIGLIPKESNPSENLEFSLSHGFSLDYFDAQATFELKLSPGLWVNKAGAQKVEQFEFGVGAKLKEIAVDVVTYTRFLVEPILSLKLGQLISPSRQTGEIFYCLYPAIEDLFLSRLTGKVQSIENLRVVNFYDLQTLLQDGLAIVNTAFRPSLEVQMPYILENFARPEINSAIATFFDEYTVSCAGYKQETFTGDDKYLTLIDNPVFSGIVFSLNNLIGGNPITINPLDVNNLVENGIIQFLGAQLNELMVFNDGPGAWSYKDAYNLNLRGASGTTDYSFFSLRNGSSITSANSVWRLETRPEGRYGLYFDMSIGNGTLLTQQGGSVKRGMIAIRLPFSVDSAIDGEKYMDDRFALYLDLALSISGVAGGKINRSNMFYSKIQDLIDYPTCLLALIDEKSLTNITTRMDGIRVGVDAPEGFSTDTRYGQVLERWANAMGLPAVQERTQNLINFWIKAGAMEAQDAFPGFLSGYRPKTCKDSKVEFSLTLPNVDYVVKAFEDATTTHESPRGDDPAGWESNLVPESNADVWTITEATNGYIAALSGALSEPKIIDQILVMFANTTSDPSRPSTFDFVYDSLVLEDDGSISIDMNPAKLLGAAFESYYANISLSKFRVENINKIQDVTLLKPYVSDRGQRSRFSTSNTFKYSSKTALNVTLSIDIEVPSRALTADDSDTQVLKETIDISMDLKGLGLETLFAAAVNEPVMSQTQLGELFDYNTTDRSFLIRDGALCKVLQFMFNDGLYFAQFQTFVTEVNGPFLRVRGSLMNEETKDLVTAFIEMALKTLRSQLPNASQGPIRDIINGYFKSMTNSTARSVCKSMSTPTWDYAGQFLDMKDFGPSVAKFVETDLTNPSSAFEFNKILRQVSASITELEAPLVELNSTRLIYNGADLGTIGFSLHKVSINGLGSNSKVSKLQLLDTSPFNDKYTFRTFIGMEGSFDIAADMSYEIDGLFSAAVGSEAASGSSYRVHNDVSLGSTFGSGSFGLDIMARIDVQALLSMYAGNLLGLYYTPGNVPCLFQIFDFQGLRLSNLTFVTDSLSLHVSCVGECTSPMLAGLQSGGEQITTDEAVYKKLMEAFKTSSKFLETVNAQEYIDEAIETAKTECTGLDFGFNFTYDDELTSAAAVMAYSGAGFAFSIMCFFLLLAWCHQRKISSLDKAFLVEKEQKLITPPMVQLRNQKLASLFQHPATSMKAKYLVPAGLFVITWLFLIANLWTVGVDVIMRVQFLGDQSADISLLQFSLASSINDMWHAKTYWLALIIFIASGAWPHTKTLLLIFSWFAPKTILSEKHRGNLLHAMDILGKWSLIDAYVMFMLQVAFRFFITTSYMQELSWLPDNLVVVDVVVVPGASIYTFVLATGAALLLSHFMVYQHRKCIEADQVLDDRIQNVVPNKISSLHRAAVQKHIFSVPDDNLTLYGFSARSKAFLLTLNVTTFLAIVTALFVPLMNFEFRGLAGFAIGVVDSDLQEVTHSAATIAASLTDGIQGVLNMVGVIFLQVMFIMFTFVTPIALTILLSVLFFIPMAIKDLKRVLFIAEIVACWDALIVLLVSVISAIIQISDLAQWIVRNSTGVYCTQLVDPLLAYLGVPAQDALCFDVIATITPSGWLLVVAVVFSTINSTIMFTVLRAGLYDRENHAKGRLDQLGVCPKNGGLILRFLVSPAISTAVDDSESIPPPNRQNKLSTKTTGAGKTMQHLLSSRNPAFSPSSTTPQSRSAIPSKASSVVSAAVRHRSNSSDLPDF